MKRCMNQTSIYQTWHSLIVKMGKPNQPLASVPAVDRGLEALATDEPVPDALGSFPVSLGRSQVRIWPVRKAEQKKLVGVCM